MGDLAVEDARQCRRTQAGDRGSRVPASDGFRGLRNMMNRATGEGIVGTSWSDPEALQRAAEAAQYLR